MKLFNKFQVEKDFNRFICFGTKFVNLQEPDCYAYGNTKKEAIKNFLEKEKEVKKFKNSNYTKQFSKYCISNNITKDDADALNFKEFLLLFDKVTNRPYFQ